MKGGSLHLRILLFVTQRIPFRIPFIVTQYLFLYVGSSFDYCLKQHEPVNPPQGRFARTEAKNRAIPVNSVILKAPVKHFVTVIKIDAVKKTDKQR